MRQRCSHAMPTSTLDPIWHTRQVLSTGRWRTRQRSNQVRPAGKIELKHNLLLLLGTPCLHCGNTILFWPLTNPPSNLRSLHCNRTAQRWSRQVHTHQAADQGNPCHEPCSTIPFSAHSIPPANSQIHPHNCRGPLGRPALAGLPA